METKEFSINEVCEMLNLSQVYVRRMIHLGKIKTRKIVIAKNTEKHLITEDEINRWRSNLQTGRRRSDGRNKYTLHATQEEIDKIQSLLLSNDIESTIVRSNKVKHVVEEGE